MVPSGVMARILTQGCGDGKKRSMSVIGVALIAVPFAVALVLVVVRALLIRKQNRELAERWERKREEIREKSRIVPT